MMMMICIIYAKLRVLYASKDFAYYQDFWFVIQSYAIDL